MNPFDLPFERRTYWRARQWIKDWSWAIIIWLALSFIWGYVDGAIEYHQQKKERTNGN